jgi:hypothetical protein
MEILSDVAPRQGCGILTRFTRITGQMQGMAAILMALWFQSPVEVRGQTPQGPYNVKLAWNASTAKDVAGYRILYGTASGTYTFALVLGNETSATVSGLAEGVTYHFVVSAFDADGVDRDFSNEVSFKPGLHSSQVGTTAAGEKILIIRGLIGRQYEIKASVDLKTWLLIDTVTIPDGGSIRFSDPEAASHPGRFYQTSLAQGDPSNEGSSKPELQISRIGTATGGETILSLRGQTGSRYDIEASVDLNTWVLIDTVTIAEAGLIRFSDPEAAGHPRRFYRTRLAQRDPLTEGSPTPELQISYHSPAAGGETILSLRGQPGSHYDIEASADLITWILITTVTIPEAGSLMVSDPDAADYPRRFYRTRQRLNPPG